MNIHEYQAIDILKEFGVAVQRGVVADTPDKAVAAAKEIQAETGSKWFVVKSQIHAGGRGKGTVKETGSKGVVLAKSIDEVFEKSKAILGGTVSAMAAPVASNETISAGLCPRRCISGNSAGASVAL